jgi:hypothetical protein
MGILAVLLAAAAAYGFGALWYMALTKQWMAAAGLTEDRIRGNGGRQSPKPYIISAICMVLVAGMMRHIFAASGIETAGLGLMAGFGLGFFIATPWIATNNAFGMRPFTLTLIDGAYASVGCALMGLVLGLF